MKTLNLKEAAALFQISSDSLRRKVCKGIVPAAKIGKQWCFIEEDLLAYIRSKYSDAALEVGGNFRRPLKCHSGNVTKRGGLYLHTTEQEYASALGLKTD